MHPSLLIWMHSAAGPLASVALSLFAPLYRVLLSLDTKHWWYLANYMARFWEITSEAWLLDEGRCWNRPRVSQLCHLNYPLSVSYLGTGTIYFEKTRKMVNCWLLLSVLLITSFVRLKKIETVLKILTVFLGGIKKRRKILKFWL